MSERLTAKTLGLSLVVLSMVITLIRHHSVAQDSASMVQVEVTGSGEKLSRDMARMSALREAYIMSLEKAFDTTIAGETVTQRLKSALNAVLSEERGYVESLEILSFKFAAPEYRMSASAYVRKERIGNDRKGLKLITDLLGKPRVLVIVDEANLGKHVTRSIAESQINKKLTSTGYAVVDHPIDVLDKLMDRKRELEDKKLLERRERTFSPEGAERTTTESITYTVDYYDLVIGYGNENTAYDYAKEKGADILILGGVYTEEVDIASALPAATKSSFHSVRAHSTIRAVVLENQTVVSSESAAATKMDLSPTTAGNEAIKDLADRIADYIIANIPLNVQL